jgi:hypothetical protein
MKAGAAVHSGSDPQYRGAPSRDDRDLRRPQADASGPGTHRALRFRGFGSHRPPPGPSALVAPRGRGPSVSHGCAAGAPGGPDSTPRSVDRRVRGCGCVPGPTPVAGAFHPGIGRRRLPSVPCRRVRTPRAAARPAPRGLRGLSPRRLSPTSSRRARFQGAGLSTPARLSRRCPAGPPAGDGGVGDGCLPARR